MALVAPAIGVVFKPDAGDRAMLDDRGLRDLRRRDDGMVVGSPATEVDTFRVMFDLESLSRSELLPPAVALDAAGVPGDVRWPGLMPGAVYAGAGERRAHRATHPCRAEVSKHCGCAERAAA